MWDKNGVANSDFYLPREPAPMRAAACPVCGRGCDTLLVARGGDLVLGCDGCVARYDALVFCGEELDCG